MRQRKRDSVDSAEPTQQPSTLNVHLDPVNEQILIAAALVDEATRLALLRRIAPEHFLVPAHVTVWAGMREIHRRNLSYDPAVLAHIVPGVDLDYLSTLEDARPDPPDNIDWHVDTLLWDKQRATAATGPLSALLEAIKDPKAEPERVRALARHVGSSFEGTSARDMLHDTDAIVRAQMLEVRKRSTGHALYPYGIKGLDYYDGDASTPRLIPGAAPGEITLVTGTSGCLTGDVRIGVNRAGIGRTFSLKDLVHRFNGGSASGKVWRKDIPTKIRFRSEDGYVRLGEVAAAYESGVKQVFRLRVSSGKEIKATADHRFLTASGWRRLGQLRMGDMLWVEGPKPKSTGVPRSDKELMTRSEHYRQHGLDGGWKHVTARTHLEQVTLIEALGEEPTYDITMREEPHNFIANNFVVHNSGKSTFTCHLVLGMARQMRTILYGAWETQGGPTLELMACLALNWSRSRLQVGSLSEDELVKLEAAMRQIGKQVRFMKNPFRRTVGEKRSNEKNLDLVQNLIADSGCDVFVADLWARCLVSRRPEEEEEALFRQQAMLEEMRVHGVLVHQQRLKDLEGRPDRRPTREGVKGSGSYIEVADTVFGIHRPALFKKLDDTTLEAIILKQRKGKWPLAVEFDWDADFGSIDGGRSMDYDPEPGDTEAGELQFAGNKFKKPGGDRSVSGGTKRNRG